MSIEQINTMVYAGRIKDRDILMNSSSGGAFTAVSDIFLQSGNVIVCAAYDFNQRETVFKLIATEAERDAAIGSKYMQSKPGHVFKEAAAWLRSNPGKSILFVGMGCQADGFRKYVELIGLRERAYIVDIICHGSTSPKIWREFAKLLEKEYKGKIEYLTFKDKRNGWKKPTAVAVINGEEVSLKEYVRVFYSRCAVRPSCHKCPYATMERMVDMTIGDFWHIEETIPDFYDPAGNSLLLVHTNRGAELFEQMMDAIDYKESNTTECWQLNLERPTPVSEKRDTFWGEHQKKGIEYIMKKYGTVSTMTRIKNKMKRIIGWGSK